MLVNIRVKGYIYVCVGLRVCTLIVINYYIARGYLHKNVTVNIS